MAWVSGDIVTTSTLLRRWLLLDHLHLAAKAPQLPLLEVLALGLPMDLLFSRSWLGLSIRE